MTATSITLMTSSKKNSHQLVTRTRTSVGHNNFTVNNPDIYLLGNSDPNFIVNLTPNTKLLTTDDQKIIGTLIVKSIY